MEGKTGLFLVVTAGEEAGAARMGLPAVHLQYRIGTGGVLQRAQGNVGSRGGWMGIYDAPGLDALQPDKLARDVQAECARRGYGGAVLDIRPHGTGQEKLADLCAALRRLHVPCCVPESAAALAPESGVLCSAAVSGGSFSELLDALCDRFGAGRICLDLVRMRSDFPMPSARPDGQPLTEDELAALRSRYHGDGFFSPELCAKYFTYRKENGSAHFVLFDDGDTAVQKVRAAREKGIGSVFLLYSEWGGEAKEIFAAFQ